MKPQCITCESLDMEKLSSGYLCNYCGTQYNDDEDMLFEYDSCVSPSTKSMLRLRQINAIRNKVCPRVFVMCGSVAFPDKAIALLISKENGRAVHANIKIMRTILEKHRSGIAALEYMLNSTIPYAEQLEG
ncbi:unnamed protein product [marine sediment metagenome]|uniref:Uncharacterized protein n=1 Tax=marine sediment metagenome TaxID=412755 RepID=X1DSA8_9ZZZZ